jgi:hypothetical protein
MTNLTTIFAVATASKSSKIKRELVRDIKAKVREYSDKVDKMNYDKEVLDEALVDLTVNPASSINDIVTVKKKIAEIDAELAILADLKDFYKMPTDAELSSLDKDGNK